MAIKSVGFVGGGRVARILLGGWAKSESLPSEIVVSDPDERVLERLTESHPQIAVATNGNERAASQDIVFLALHPPAIAGVAAKVENLIPVKPLAELEAPFREACRTRPPSLLEKIRP